MKLGLIPPRRYEEYALYSDFHLALGIPECTLYNAYTQTYKDAAARGDFVIVDNGAAEGAELDMQYVMRWARDIKANEIVLPDHINNRERTITAIERFFEGWGTDPQAWVERPFRYMAVIHATSVRTAYNMATMLADRYPQIKTLGIPRSICATIGRRQARIDVANDLASKLTNRFQLHFLGANPNWIMELYYAAKYAPHVRSMDTSAPFNYAIAGEDVFSKKVITRPTGYFRAVRTIDAGLIKSNIETMKAWANAEATPTSRV